MRDHPSAAFLRCAFPRNEKILHKEVCRNSSIRIIISKRLKIKDSFSRASFMVLVYHAGHKNDCIFFE